MIKPVKYITEKTNKNLRAEYNEIYTKDIKRDYFTEEDRKRLEEIKKRNLVRVIYEYRVAKKQMDKKAKYRRGHLVLQIIPQELEQYKINYYISSYSCDWMEPVLEGDSFLSKNELEAFYYYHSKQYETTIFVGSETSLDTTTFLCMEEEEEYEFFVIGKMDLVKIQSLNAVIKSEQVREKKKTLEFYCK